MLEEAEADLHGENARDGFVDLFDGDLSAGDGGSEVLPVGSGTERHLHVDARLEAAHGGVREIFCETVGLEILDGVGVADYEALEAPILAEDVMQQPAVAGGGHVVEIHVGGHGGADTGLDCGVEGREVDVPHLIFRDVGGVIVASAFGGAVSGEVLHAGENVFGRADVWALKAANLRGRHRGAEVGVFACALDDASPAGITCDVEHGREGPVDADGAGLPRGDGLRLFFNRRVPRCGHGDGNRKDGAEAVDDVEAEDERDVQARLLDRDVLELVDHSGIGNEEQRAELAFGDGAFDLVGFAKHELLAELADFFLEGHLLEERGDAGVNLLVRDLAGRRSSCGDGRCLD